MSLLQSMSTRGKLLLAASIIGIAVVGFLLVSVATKPTYTTLGAGLDPAQTGKLTGALDSQGISYKLANGGTAIDVPSADVARARVALAGAGLSASGGGNDSWAQFDKQKLGSSNFQQQVAYQRALENQIAQTVGANKAQVRVKSDLNVDATQRDELSYAKQGTPVETTEDTERLKGTGGAGASGAAGAKSNIPTYAAGAGGSGGNSNYQRKQGTTKFGVGRVVTHTKVAPGAVQRLDVALLVDPTVPPKTAKALQQAISSAAGINTQRGDTISLSSVPFAKQPAAAATAKPIADILGYAKWGALGLGSLLFLFFVTRHLKKRESSDLIGEPVWLRQIEQPRPVAELAAGHDTAHLTSNPN